MSDLVRQGKVRYVGICEAGAATIRRAHAMHPLSTVQIEYSLWSRDEAEILPLCAELGIGFVAYKPTNAGLAPDLLHVNRLALVGEARVAGDDEEPSDARRAR
jgi:aryl-alcohol dehydrogenase-like predicted oxidoreductase